MILRRRWHAMRSRHRKTVVVLGVAIACLATVGWLDQLRPERVTHDEYARRLCREVLVPLGRTVRDPAADADLTRFRDGGARTTGDREAAIVALAAVSERAARQISRLGAFNDQYLIVGTDGNRLRREFDRALDLWFDADQERRGAIELLDPADVEHLGVQVAAIEQTITGLVLDADVADIVGGLRQDMARYGPECTQALGLVTVAAE